MRVVKSSFLCLSFEKMSVDLGGYHLFDDGDSSDDDENENGDGGMVGGGGRRNARLCWASATLIWGSQTARQALPR